MAEQQHVTPVALATRGLTETEAAARRAQGQGNSAPSATTRSYARILRENVFTFINNCLFGLGIALVLLGRPLDALISVGVILLNVVVSVVQEVRAKRTLDRIALLTRPTATVLRDGRERTVPPDEVVLGDTLLVGPGDQIVVDGRVSGDGALAVDESLLTGESDLIAKKAGDTVYSGTFCVTGSGAYVAEHVGAQSVANQLTARARAYRRVLTPLQRTINLVVRVVLLVVVYAELLLTVNAVLAQRALAESVQNSTIVAGLIPNGLFLAIAVAYAVGAVRIIRFGALVQQINAIESLSHVNVLCLDKTGTLTANRLQVRDIQPLGDIAEVELRRVLGDVVASMSSGNHTSDAIAAGAPGTRRHVVAEVPFSSARKWSAVACDDERLRGVYALGAPELLQPYLRTDADESATGATGEPGEPAQSMREAARAWTARGLRVLLVVSFPDPTRLVNAGDASHLPVGMTPLGLVSLSDELRPEAHETLLAFRRAGVRPKIISGDNPETVAALAAQAGLDAEARLVSGIELGAMDEARFREAAATATIFGRITPEQKERLVRALRESGSYVAMIGDGVNDILALKQAQLGIAMQSGSQATRNVADIVLLNDAFGSLAPAVLEGQRIVNGMTNVLRLFLTRITTVGLVIFSALLIGVFPLTLRSASLITLVTVGVPTVLLALWAQPGPTPPVSFVRQIIHFVLPAALLSSVIGLALFFGTLLVSLPLLTMPASAQVAAGDATAAVAASRTELAAFLALCGILLVIYVEPPTPWWVGGDTLSSDRRPAYLALGLAVALVGILLLPPLRAFFDLVPLDLDDWLLLAAAVAIWGLLVRWVWRSRLLDRFLNVELMKER